MGLGKAVIVTASLIFRIFQVKMLQGNIDISFRIKGHKGTHKVHLSAVPSLLISFVWCGKALARFTLRVSAENAEVLSRLVRIRFHTLSSFLHPSSRIFLDPNVFHTVRFKIIADDGTVILIPCETSPLGDESHAS
jgi:hypothetical protein